MPAPRQIAQKIPRSPVRVEPPPAAPARPSEAYSASCPAGRALSAIASKWGILTLHRLKSGPMRFNALQRALPGISRKVLVDQLRRLERFGLVTRTTHAGSRGAVHYALTAAAIELKPALDMLCAWAEKHLRGDEHGGR